MAVPKKKTSITRRKRRHAQWQRKQLNNIMSFTNLVKCKECSKYKKSHRVCHHCGYYKGKQVINIKSSGKQQIIEE